MSPFWEQGKIECLYTKNCCLLRITPQEIKNLNYLRDPLQTVISRP